VLLVFYGIIWPVHSQVQKWEMGFKKGAKLQIKLKTYILAKFQVDKEWHFKIHFRGGGG
jgi:hypothetical protein